jgi:hypothetical protein
MEGGFPFKASYQPAVCHIYIELRLTPVMRPTDALSKLRIVLDRVQRNIPELEYDLEVYASNFPIDSLGTVAPSCLWITLV